MTDAQADKDRQERPPNRKKLKVDRVDMVYSSLKENITVKRKMLHVKEMLMCMNKEGKQKTQTQSVTVDEQTDNCNLRQKENNVSTVSFTFTN